MDVNSLVGIAFSGLSALVVEDVMDGGAAVVVTARTRDVAVLCPVCGTPTAKVHGYHRRTVTDVPGRRPPGRRPPAGTAAGLSDAFAREGGHLCSDTVIRSGCVAIQGSSAHGVRSVRLAGRDVRLVVNEDQEADADALAESFAGPAHERWTSVELGGQEGLLSRLEVWLAGAIAPYGRLRATPEAAQRGLVGWVLSPRMPAVWDDGSLAYLTLRQVRQAGPERYELGVIAHGRRRERLASRLAEVVRRFDGEARDSEPVVRIYRLDDRTVSGGVSVDKPSVRLTVS